RRIGSFNVSACSSVRPVALRQCVASAPRLRFLQFRRQVPVRVRRRGVTAVCPAVGPARLIASSPTKGRAFAMHESMAATDAARERRVPSLQPCADSSGTVVARDTTFPLRLLQDTLPLSVSQTY